MKLIDKIIKILINFKYKRESFDVWSWGINDVHEINILSAEYYDDHYRYGTKERYYKPESEKRLIEADAVKEALRNRIGENIDECIDNVLTVNILDNIRAEIRKKMRFNQFNEGIVSFDDISKILDKYEEGGENKDE